MIYVSRPAHVLGDKVLHQDAAPCFPAEGDTRSPSTVGTMALIDATIFVSAELTKSRPIYLGPSGSCVHTCLPCMPPDGTYTRNEHPFSGRHTDRRLRFFGQRRGTRRPGRGKFRFNVRWSSRLDWSHPRRTNRDFSLRSFLPSFPFGHIKRGRLTDALPPTCSTLRIFSETSDLSFIMTKEEGKDGCIVFQLLGKLKVLSVLCQLVLMSVSIR